MEVKAKIVRILRAKTMSDILMYIPNDDKQNYPLQLILWINIEGIYRRAEKYPKTQPGLNYQN